MIYEALDNLYLRYLNIALIFRTMVILIFPSVTVNYIFSPQNGASLDSSNLSVI